MTVRQKSRNMDKVELDEKIEVETKIDYSFHCMPSEKLDRFEKSLSPEYWEYRRRWRDYPAQHIVSDFPIHLDIEATTKCNLKCTMCPREELIKTHSFWKIQDFDFKTYVRLIDEGAENGLCSIKYNYLGEPLLNKRIPEMIRYAKQKDIIDVMFNTNATLLTEEMSRILVEAGLDKLFFSFDSPYAEHYNAIRVGADYHKTLNNIRRFVEIRDELGSLKPLVRISMVRMRENEKEWDDFKKLFKPIVDVVAYVDYLDHTGQTSTDKMIDPRSKNKKKFCCPQLWQRMFIHPDGFVTVCCIDAARELKIGNIFEKSVKEIWLSEDYQHLRDLHAKGRSGEIPICSKCPLARY